jgi:formate/nitrite transporter FocA (FNT family)
MASISAKILALPWWQCAVRAGAAGWLIGLMVWLLPASGSARPLVIVLLTYVVAMCEFPHIIAGSVEAAYGVFTGHASVTEYVTKFLVPVALGNTIGGTALAALLNHAPVASDMQDRQSAAKNPLRRLFRRAQAQHVIGR